MGRKVVEATKACRMRRTRGDMVRRRRRAAGLWLLEADELLWAVDDFAALPDDFADEALCSDFFVAGFEGEDEDCELEVCAGDGAGASCGECTRAAVPGVLKLAHTRAATTHCHHLRPSRTTFFFCAETRMPEPVQNFI